MASQLNPVTVSAPGKILLAGGYLVLEAPHQGFVIAADKRFYTNIRISESKGAAKDTVITVVSPQFHLEWKYSYSTETGTLVADLDNATTNPFVEKSLRVSFFYLHPTKEMLSSNLVITIYADNDFYSVLPHLPKGPDGSSIDRTPAAVEALPKFLKCPLDNDGKAIVNKTGLGSSAALTTSLVGALVYFFTNNNESKDEDLPEKIHNLAQICHSYAQGKVGSGFDVSAACHGTHVYCRFPKCLLPDLLQQLEDVDQHTDHNTQNLQDTLTRLVELVPWKEGMVQEITLPKGQLQILLADVRGGSESPSMARTVLNWKAQHPGSDIPHWTALSQLNAKVVELIRGLSSSPIASEEYDKLSKLVASDWPAESPLLELHRTFMEIRTDLREMGEAAGVPIEPPPQTALCDATMKIPGVITALVPGAGGYDAVACLYIDRPSVLESIGKLWAEWKEPIICPLAVRATNGGLQLEKQET
ncbi:GHMP-like kinase [Nitzschia inconspicua]|uniref:GHMP-like kinase n=1 Tax=Nitzschia inconspicua TaxID=303405 RepID=A0A9K3LCC2_9STRA|nr:GHMP-like kinase [Nitzschia inconspicua]KAG7359492.1 GHMP-like kinase [Nitzschia inconspicua]